MIEAQCVGCGKRYRLKGDPEAMDFLAIPCPECGGMLEVLEEERPEYEFLTEKPLALFFWELEEEKESLSNTLQSLGYEVRSVTKAPIFNRWLRFNLPSLVILGARESEKIDPFMEVLNRLPMEERRKVFVVWVTPLAQTLDPKEAFLKSLELVINTKDLPRLAEVLERGKRLWQDFYTPYLQVEKALEEEI